MKRKSPKERWKQRYHNYRCAYDYDDVGPLQCKEDWKDCEEAHGAYHYSLLWRRGNLIDEISLIRRHLVKYPLAPISLMERMKAQMKRNYAHVRMGEDRDRFSGGERAR